MYKKIAIFILFIIIIFLIFSFTNYINYNQIVSKERDPIRVDESEDFENLIRIKDVKLNNNGFSFEDRNSISKYNLDDLSLEGILKSLGKIKDESVVHLKYNNDVRTIEKKEYVNLNIEPVEALYIPNQERTYIKIYYTAHIENPIMFASKGKYILNNNYWINLFGYSKLHYVSKDGEEKYEYIKNNLLDGSEVQFNIKSKQGNRVFYLKGISGIIIANKNGYSDISSYSEYSHQHIFDYKTISQVWMDFSLGR